MNAATSILSRPRYVIPDIPLLHRLVHSLLPPPNRGLWEPLLGLDRLLLSYFALDHQQQNPGERRPMNATDLHLSQQADDEEEEEEEEYEDDDSV